MNDAKELSNIARLDVLEMVKLSKASHIGSNFSAADILSVLYTKFLNIDPKHPKFEARDRFFLSKGHSVSVLYSILANLGFFSKDLLKTFYQKGSILLGHSNYKVPGIEFSTGSLGHALSVANGVALASFKKKQTFKSVVLLGDGELDEGSNWEAILFASHNHLNNLYIIIDYNKIQSLGRCKNVLNLEPLKEKFLAFNCEVKECDGHNLDDIEKQLKSFNNSSAPHVLIANTIKGKGVSFMENLLLWHYRCPNDEEYKSAKKELLLNA